jgi:hypothetical protein
VACNLVDSESVDVGYHQDREIVSTWSAHMMSQFLEKKSDGAPPAVQSAHFLRYIEGAASDKIQYVNFIRCLNIFNDFNLLPHRCTNRPSVSP